MCGQKELCNGGVVIFLCFGWRGCLRLQAEEILPRVAAAFMAIGRSEGRDRLRKMQRRSKWRFREQQRSMSRVSLAYRGLKGGLSH